MKELLPSPMSYLSNLDNNHSTDKSVVQQERSQSLDINGFDYVNRGLMTDQNLLPVPPTAIAVAIARFSSK